MGLSVAEISVIATASVGALGVGVPAWGAYAERKDRRKADAEGARATTVRAIQHALADTANVLGDSAPPVISTRLVPVADDDTAQARADDELKSLDSVRREWIDARRALARFSFEYPDDDMREIGNYIRKLVDAHLMSVGHWLNVYRRTGSLEEARDSFWNMHARAWHAAASASVSDAVKHLAGDPGVLERVRKHYDDALAIADGAIRQERDKLAAAIGVEDAET